MKVAYFEDYNIEFVKDQLGYFLLSVYKSKSDAVMSCWKMSWKERIKVLFTGKVYLQFLTFNNPSQQQKMSTNNPIKTISYNK